MKNRICHARSFETLLPKRLIFVAPPAPGEEPEITLESITLDQTQNEGLKGIAKSVRDEVNAVKSSLRGAVAPPPPRPREGEGLKKATLLHSAIDDLRIDDAGHICIRSGDHVSSYEIRDNGALHLLDPELSEEKKAALLRQTGPETQPAPHITQMLEAAHIFGQPQVLETKKTIAIPDTSLSLHAEHRGGEFTPQSTLMIGPSHEKLIDTDQYAIVTSLVRSVRSAGGALLEISLTVAPKRPFTGPKPAHEEKKIIAAVDPQGRILAIDPSTNATKGFQVIDLGGDRSVISVGTGLMIRHRDRTVFLKTPFLRKCLEKHTVGGGLTVLKFERYPKGQVMVAISPDGAVVSLDHQPYLEGDAVLYDQQHIQLVSFNSHTGDAPNVKAMNIISFGGAPAGAPPPTPETDLDRGRRTEISQALEGFSTAFPETITAAELATARTRLQTLAEIIQADILRDASLHRLHEILTQAKENLQRFGDEAIRTERRRRAELKKLEDYERTFRDAIEKLPASLEHDLASHMARIDAYIRAEESFISERNGLTLIPEARMRQSQALLDTHQRQNQEDQQQLAALVKKEVEELKTEGKELLNLKGLRGESGAVTLEDKERRFQTHWKPRVETVKRLHTGYRKYLPQNEIGEKLKKDLDLALTRGDEHTKDDIRRFQIAHIEHFAEELFKEAGIQCITAKMRKDFEDDMTRLRGLERHMREGNSVEDIEARHMGLREELGKAYERLQKSPLKHDDEVMGTFEGFQDELPKALEEAKRAQEEKESRAQQEKRATATRKAEDLVEKIARAARPHEADKALSPDDQSKAAWHRVQLLVRGYDLSKKQRRPSLPHAAYSTELDELAPMIDEIKTKFLDLDTANRIWQMITDALDEASNSIEADRGRALSPEPGHYCYRMPRCYQERLGVGREIPDVLIPLSGKNAPIDLRVKTEVDRKGKHPVLKLRLVGDGRFERVLPLNDRNLMVLPVYEWESPKTEKELEDYQGPIISREEMAVYLLLLAANNASNEDIFFEDLFDILALSDEGKRQERLSSVACAFFKTLGETHGITLSEDQKENAVNLLASILPTLREAYEKANGKPIKNLFESGARIEISQVKQTHPRFEAGVYENTLAEFGKNAERFFKKYGNRLIRLHRYVRRNEKRVQEQLGLAQQRPSRLPSDYRETGIEIVRLRALQDARKIIAQMKDKRAIFLIGDFGGGKTVGITAICTRGNRRLHFIRGNLLQGATSLDPFQECKTKRDRKAAKGQQLFLLNASLSQMERTTMCLDESQFIPPEVFNSLLNAFDTRGELTVSVATEEKEDPADLDVYDESGFVTIIPGNDIYFTANKSYTARNPSTGESEIRDFQVPEAWKRRVEVVDFDSIDEQHAFLWIASYVERGSADLGIHPDDVKYLISKRLLHGEFQRAQVPDASQMKTDFSTDPERLAEITTAIDHRCLAATLIVEIQKASRRTRQSKDKPSELGIPPCWMTTVGGGDVKTLMPQLTHDLSQAQAREIIARHLMQHVTDRGESYVQTNKLWVEHITGVWREYSPEDWESAERKARELKEQGMLAEDPRTATIQMLDRIEKALIAQGAASTTEAAQLRGIIQAQQIPLERLASLAEEGKLNREAVMTFKDFMDRTFQLSEHPEQLEGEEPAEPEEELEAPEPPAA